MSEIIAMVVGMLEKYENSPKVRFLVNWLVACLTILYWAVLLMQSNGGRA